MLYKIKRINSNNLFSINIDSDVMIITNEQEQKSIHYKLNAETIEIESLDLTAEFKDLAAEILFSHFEQADIVKINNQEIITREAFFQKPGIWNAPTNNQFPLEEWIETNSVAHPKRYPFTAGQQLYSRYVKAIDAVVSFRVIQESDLDTFHDWHNQPRVADFWELALPKEELRKYITKGLNDPHNMPVITEINGEAAGYFEIYWTKEDRLGPYYDSAPFDRGFHLLVGNTKFLGFNNTDALLKSVTHFIFLDEPRTRFIMGEPRHDNQKILRYVLSFKSWRKVKEFDFPHKRAALLECNREKFFLGKYL